MLLFFSPRILPGGGGGAQYIFWVRGRAILKGIDFRNFGIRNGIDFRNFGIRNGIDFHDFGIRNGINQ